MQIIHSSDVYIVRYADKYFQLNLHSLRLSENSSSKSTRQDFVNNIYHYDNVFMFFSIAFTKFHLDEITK